MSSHLSNKIQLKALSSDLGLSNNIWLWLSAVFLTGDFSCIAIQGGLHLYHHFHPAIIWTNPTMAQHNHCQDNSLDGDIHWHCTPRSCSWGHIWLGHPWPIHRHLGLQVGTDTTPWLIQCSCIIFSTPRFYIYQFCHPLRDGNPFHGNLILSFFSCHLCLHLFAGTNKENGERIPFFHNATSPKLCSVAIALRIVWHTTSLGQKHTQPLDICSSGDPSSHIYQTILLWNHKKVMIYWPLRTDWTLAGIIS